MKFTEPVGKHAVLAWLRGPGWSVQSGRTIALGEPTAQLDDYGQAMLAQRLRDAPARPNRALATEALDGAYRKRICPEGAELDARNGARPRLLVDGVTMEHSTAVATQAPQ